MAVVVVVAGGAAVGVVGVDGSYISSSTMFEMQGEIGGVIMDEEAEEVELYKSDRYAAALFLSVAI